MDIKTKFKIGQDVFFLLNNEIRFGMVKKIEITIICGSIDVLYTLSSNYGMIEAFENYLFKDKEELINSF